MAVVWLALFLVLLMIMAAIVVDVGNAHQQRASAQSAVDGAALSAAQVLKTNQNSQPSSVFDLAANATFNSLFLHHAIAGATGTCAANGSALTPPAVCDDYQYTSSGIAYDVQVTTPYIGPNESTPDTSMLNVKTCWSVPTVFGRVVGTNSIPMCANATAQNGIGSRCECRQGWQVADHRRTICRPAPPPSGRVGVADPRGESTAGSFRHELR